MTSLIHGISNSAQMNFSTKQTHQLDRLELEQAVGVGEGQGSLACCSPRGRLELDTTE